MLMMIMMMLIIITIIIIIIIIIMVTTTMIIITTITTTTTTTTIAFQGAIRGFLQSPHCAANRLQHVRSSGPGAILCKSRATHRAPITCNMSCYVPCCTKGQLSN